MPNVLAMSFEGALTPSFDLHCLAPGRKPPDGWGIGCYPGGEASALVMKEAAPAQGSIRSALVSTWERLASSIFLMHVRKHDHPKSSLFQIISEKKLKVMALW